MSVYEEQTPALQCRMHFKLFVEGENLIIENEKKRTKEVISIANIQSFLVKKGSRFVDGHVTFATAQSATASASIGFGVSPLGGAEKDYAFSYTDNFFAKKLQDYIANYREQSSEIPSSDAPTNNAVAIPTDELRALKSLLDDGIITQDEFDAKKKQLLKI